MIIDFLSFAGITTKNMIGYNQKLHSEFNTVQLKNIVGFCTIVIVFILVGCREKTDYVGEWIGARGHGTENTHPPVAISAILKEHNGHEIISFRLTNISGKELDAYPFELPWGYGNLLNLVAITSTGKFIKASYLPIMDNFTQEKIHIPPGGNASGDYDLSNRFSFATMPQNEDTIILWSYAVPSSLSPDFSVCSGSVILKNRGSQ